MNISRPFLLLQFDAPIGEYEICLSNDRRFEQDAKHVMLSITEIGGACDMTLWSTGWGVCNSSTIL